MLAAYLPDSVWPYGASWQTAVLDWIKMDQTLSTTRTIPTYLWLLDRTKEWLISAVLIQF